MFEGLKKLFSSSKFWLTIIGSAICGGLQYAGAPQEFTTLVAGLFGLNIVGQGMADMGKNKALPPPK